MKYLILLSFLSLSSCAYFQENIKKPIVHLKKVDVKDMTFNDANFVFNLGIENPNKVALAIDQVTYNLELNGKPFTQGVFAEKITVAAESASSVSLPIKVKYTDLMQSLNDYLQDQSVDYKLDGSVKMGLLSIPFKNSGQVDIDKK